MELKKLTLEDIFPQPATFKLSATGDHEHVLRPINMADQAWIAETFGGQEAVNEMFVKQDLLKQSRLLFHQLVDKSPFAAMEEDEWNENGEKVGKKKVGGVDAILRSIHGVKEHIVVVKALLRTIGISEPIYEEMQKGIAEAAKAEAEKEFKQEAEKKRVESPPVKKQSPRKSTGKKSKTK